METLTSDPPFISIIPHNKFHPFQSLLKELRLIIWDFAINERRILGVQRESASAIEKRDYTKGWKISAFTATPSILQINSESRQHALKSYRLLFPLETKCNLYINELDSLYLFTPPYEDDNDIDVIYKMWLEKGEMELACKYLCGQGKMKSLMMDYKHLCYGDEETDFDWEHAELWARSLYALKSLSHLTFVRNGDTELFKGQRLTSQLTLIPEAFDSKLRHYRSEFCKEDDLQEAEHPPFATMTICDCLQDD